MGVLLNNVLYSDAPPRVSSPYPSFLTGRSLVYTSLPCNSFSYLQQKYNKICNTTHFLFVTILLRLSDFVSAQPLRKVVLQTAKSGNVVLYILGFFFIFFYWNALLHLISTENCSYYKRKKNN